MASVYLRPTADNYCTFTKTPSDSPNAYSLVDDVTSDGESTCLTLTAPTADTRATASASFMLSGAGITIPLDEYRITNLRVVTNGSRGLYSGDCYTSVTVTSNGLVGMSDLSTAADLNDGTFDRSGEFLDMFRNYYKTNGRFPDVRIDITRHMTPTKKDVDWYISQLYLEVIYNAGIQVKGTKSNAYFGPQPAWLPAHVLYRKRNGTWESVRDGVSQLASQFNKPGHRITIMPAKAAKCTTTGLTAGCKCEACNEVFLEQTVVPATGHGETKEVAAKEATCGKAGYTAGVQCTECSAYLSGHETIPATGNHTPKDVAAKEPTCGDAGYTAGTKCSECSTYLSGHETIPATGNHTPVDIGVTEPTCGSVGYTAGTQCSVCNAYLSGHETIPATGNHTPVDDANGVEATDIHDGYTSSTSCSVCGQVLIKPTLIPHGGNHVCTLVTVPGYAATCASAGLTDGKQCSVCGKWHVYQEVIPATGKHTLVTVPGYAATCGATGLTDGQRCSVCGKVTVAQTTIPATGNHGSVLSGGKTICPICGYIHDWSAYATLAYYGEAPSPSHAASRSAAGTVGNYALFTGGLYNNKRVDAYNASLTRSTPAELSERMYYHAATTLNGYLLVGGNPTTAMNAYDTSLTRHTPTSVTKYAQGLSATTVGSYALFGSGRNGSTMHVYNAALTMTTTTALSNPGLYAAATTVGNYGLFAGGLSGTSPLSSVEAYDSSLTKHSVASLSRGRYNVGATTVGDYAVFAGGNSSDNCVDAYDGSLTKIVAAPLSYDIDTNTSGTTVGNYALFANHRSVHSYNQSLTQTIASKEVLADSADVAATVGNYALIAIDDKAIVYAYKLQ